MSWVKLDDQFFGHPKVLNAGGDAALLYLAGLCYCQAHLTDGVIPSAAIPRLTDRRTPMKLADQLVEVKLWEWHPAGFKVHDYHDHNAKSEKVKAKREATRKRVAEWREKHGHNGVTDAGSNNVTNAEVTPPPTANRLPLTASSGKPDKPPRGQAALKGVGFDFEAVYAKYPRKIGKAKGLVIAKREVRTPADFAALERAVGNYAAEVAGRETDKIAHFSTFMGRWRDHADEESTSTSTEYQPCTATPEEIAAWEERDRARGADFLAGKRSLP